MDLERTQDSVRHAATPRCTLWLVLVAIWLVAAGCSGGIERQDPAPNEESQPATDASDEASSEPASDEATDESATETAEADPMRAGETVEQAGEVVYTATPTPESIEATDDAVELAVQGNVQAAISKLEDVLASDDQAFVAAFNLGVLRDQEGQRAAAKKAYERALAIEPQFSPALLNLVRLELRAGRPAVTLAERYVDAHPDNLGHKLARLEALVAAERYQDVIEGARVVLKRDEANPRARYYLALAHHSAGRHPLAGYIIDEALKVSAADPELHFLDGLVNLELDDEVAARQAFARAVERRPDYPEAQNALGLLLYRNRDFADAEAAFRTAVRYAPGFQEAWLNLGNVLKAMDRGNEAEQAYQKALELDPDWADAHFSLGALYLAHEVVALDSLEGLERLEKARAELVKARDGFTQDDEARELAAQFIAKADTAIEIRKAELEFEEEGDGDPFGDGGGDDGDPFADEGDDGDPFADEDDGDPFADEDDGDPFADEDDDAGGDDSADEGASEDDGDPFDDGDGK